MWVYLGNVTKRFKISHAILDLSSEVYHHLHRRRVPALTHHNRNPSRSTPPALLLKPVPSPLLSKPLTNPCKVKHTLKENVDIPIDILQHRLPKEIMEFSKNGAYNLLLAMQFALLYTNKNRWTNCSSLSGYI